MLHACFTPIAICFVYTSWHFCAFSGTNLLRRCHSASSCFLLFSYSRYLPKEIFSKLDETKPEVPIFLSHTRSPKGRWRRAGMQPHHRLARAHLWPRHRMVWAPRVSTDLTLLPIYCLRRKNSKEVGIHPRKVLQRRRHRDKFWGIEVSVSAPCRDRKFPPEPSSSTPPPSSSLLLTPMMRRE
jgi:hypothetical protein